MAIAYVGEVKVPSVDDAANQGTTVTFTPPSMTSGDFVLVYVATYLGSQSWSVTTTGGQTWSEVFDETRTGTHALYWCIYNGTWSADPVFTRTGASANDIMGRMVVLRGVDQSSPWDVNPSARTAADTNDQDFTTFNTNYDGSWAVWGGFEIDNNTCETNNGGAWDNEATTQVGWRVSTLLSMAWCRKYVATAGAAGATTLNYSANDAGGKWSGAIRKAVVTVSHTAGSATDAGGAHAKALGRSLTAASATGAGGAHAKTLGRVLVAGGVTITGGTLTATRSIPAVAGEATVAGGDHTASVETGGEPVNITHTAGEATVTGGTHTLSQSVIAYPDADITDGGWLNELASATDLYASIDEIWPADDDDYIMSSGAPSADACTVGLSNVSDPSSSTGHLVRYRYGKRNATTTIDLTVRLLQGAVTIASWDHTDIAVAPADAEQTLTSGQADAITDYSDLRLQFEASEV